MDEEITAVEKATGWPLRVRFLQADDAASVEEATTEIVASINEGRPVLAYEPKLNMDVVYGYEQGGQVLLLRDYHRREEPLRLPPSKLGFLILFIGDRGEPMARRDAVTTSLKTAVRNWGRDRGRAGPGEYWYGRAALEHWIADVRGDVGTEGEDNWTLRHVCLFNLRTMHDARKAAVTYLEGSAELLGGAETEALRRAAEVYASEADMLGDLLADEECFPKKGDALTLEARRRVPEVLSRAMELEEAAISEIQRARVVATV
jgi:hypothetical protein